jgi:hypothetical protein
MGSITTCYGLFVYIRLGIARADSAKYYINNEGRRWRHPFGQPHVI